MGYRSTFVTTDTSVKIPGWFIEKWKDCVHFHGATLPISSKYEGKRYGMFAEIEDDLKRVLQETDDPGDPIYGDIFRRKIIIVWLGEDGAVLRNEITKDGIKYSGSVGDSDA